MLKSDARERLQMEEASADFVERYPSYVETEAIDTLRATEYRRLDACRQIYLDYTGGSLYSESQLEMHTEMLRNCVFGNPHSANPTSTAMTDHVERARRAVLDYFRAGNDYILVFTQNASGGLKLVGESFPFASGSRCLLTFDNHNSVNGIREFARARGADVEYAPVVVPGLRIDLARLETLLDKADPARPNLFAFPAQSNYSGVKHPLDLVAKAQSRGWSVLLDAAAFVPTNALDLQAVQPDFVTISFYKMFGYPTGIGALLIRRPAFQKLKRPWFAGGTVKFASVQGQGHLLSSDEAAFEDGTLNYLSVPAVEIGLAHLQAIGIEKISERVRCLTGWLLEELVALRHSTGRAVVHLYGPASTESRGGTVTFNLHDSEGHLLDYRRVEELASAEGISLRTGCFCNPGAGEIAEGLTEEDLQAGFTMGPDLSLPSFVRMMKERGTKSLGSIRASLGLVTNFSDVWHFFAFVAGFRDQTRKTIGDVSVADEDCRVIRDGS